MFCPEWSEADLEAVLLECDGDLVEAVSRITDGTAARWTDDRKTRSKRNKAISKQAAAPAPTKSKPRRTPPGAPAKVDTAAATAAPSKPVHNPGRQSAARRPGSPVRASPRRQASPGRSKKKSAQPGRRVKTADASLKSKNWSAAPEPGTSWADRVKGPPAPVQEPEPDIVEPPSKEPPVVKAKKSPVAAAKETSSASPMLDDTDAQSGYGHLSSQHQQPSSTAKSGITLNYSSATSTTTYSGSQAATSKYTSAQPAPSTMYNGIPAAATTKYTSTPTSPLLASPHFQVCCGSLLFTAVCRIPRRPFPPIAKA